MASKLQLQLLAVMMCATLILTASPMSADQSVEVDAAATAPIEVDLTVPGLADLPCVPEQVPGFGLACPATNGFYELYDLTGNVLGLTHGSDPTEKWIESGAGTYGGTAGKRDPHCVEDGTHYAHVFYVRASDAADDYAKDKPVLQDIVREANAMVNANAQLNGDNADIRVLCDGGEIVVTEIVLPTTKAETKKAGFIYHLRDLGYDDVRVKYWVWINDTSLCGCSGNAIMAADETPGIESQHNMDAYAKYANTYGYYSTRTMLHELGHTIGAVQGGAPYTSGAAHCTDGLDTMCYNDGGPHSWRYTWTACTIQVWDCNQNTYFNTDPAPHTYLANNWNLGSGNSYIIDVNNGRPNVASESCTGPDTNGDISCSWHADDPESGNVHYDVKWPDGSTQRVPAAGTVPAGTTVSATKNIGSDTEYTVLIRADDGGTNGLSPWTPVDKTKPTIEWEAPLLGHAYATCNIISLADDPQTFMYQVWDDLMANLGPNAVAHPTAGEPATIFKDGCVKFRVSDDFWPSMEFSLTVPDACPGFESKFDYQAHANEWRTHTYPVCGAGSGNVALTVTDAAGNSITELVPVISAGYTPQPEQPCPITGHAHWKVEAYCNTAWGRAYPIIPKPSI